jgi:hypothetical protein
LSLINGFSFAPITSTEHADDAIPVCEANSQNIAFDLTETVEPLLGLTMLQVPGDNAMWISESVLSLGKGNLMLILVGPILF